MEISMGEFPKPAAAPAEYLANELETALVGAVIRLTHRTDRAVWNNTRRSPLAHRKNHIRCCERCQAMLREGRLSIEALLDELSNAVQR
ncbi:MAG: hypothetical protein Q7S84_03215 [bacterium]|nr:hypothetical protein [bacterium]